MFEFAEFGKPTFLNVNLMNSRIEKEYLHEKNPKTKKKVINFYRKLSSLFWV